MYQLKTAAGVLVAQSTRAIFVDGAVFRSIDQVWLDPTPASGAYIEEVADPVAVPGEVTMRQARLALLAAGKLAAVQTAIDAMQEPAKTAAQITWDYSSVVQRHNGLVAQLGPALNLNEAQIDALFIAAAAL